jgi:hypothetical protein
MSCSTPYFILVRVMVQVVVERQALDDASRRDCHVRDAVCGSMGLIKGVYFLHTRNSNLGGAAGYMGYCAV